MMSVPFLSYHQLQIRKKLALEALLRWKWLYFWGNLPERQGGPWVWEQKQANVRYCIILLNIQYLFQGLAVIKENNLGFEKHIELEITAVVL